MIRRFLLQLYKDIGTLHFIFGMWAGFIGLLVLVSVTISYLFGFISKRLQTNKFLMVFCFILWMVVLISFLFYFDFIELPICHCSDIPGSSSNEELAGGPLKMARLSELSESSLSSAQSSSSREFVLDGSVHSLPSKELVDTPGLVRSWTL